MAKLNIELVADAQKALGGLNDVTESTSSLLNQLIKGEAVSDKFANALSRDLSVAADKAGGGIKSLQAQLKELMKYQERARLGLGDTSDAYTTINDLTKEANKEITRLTEAEKAATQETQEYAEATKSATPATKEFSLSVKKADEQTTSYGKKLVSIAANIFKFQLLMGPITSAIRGFKDFLRESTQVAAEAEQVFNKLSTVFDNMSDSAMKAADSLAQMLGISRSTAASSLSTVGDLLQAQGMGTGESLSLASTWTKQFSDIIAFKDINMSLNEFAQNFMSGAAGNLRNFRTFGSIVKESAVNAELAKKGLDKLTGSQLELAKMTTRASIALEQQANAMGATEREWDTMLSINRRLNEASKQLKENFGSWLNESLKPIKTIWLEILDTINEAVASSRDLPQFNENMQKANPTVMFSRSANADLWERESRLHAGGWANMYGMLSETTDAGEISKLESNLRYEAQQIVRMFVSFGMTVDEGIAALQEDYITMQSLTDDWYGDLDIFGGFIEYLGRYSEWAKRMLGRSEWDMETESVGSGFENYLESLRLLTGAGNISAGEMMNANSHMSFAAQLAVASRDAAERALNGINAADLTEFVDAVSLALGEATEEDMLKGKAETLKSLYSILFNQFTKDGTLKQNADILERIANEYKEITAENIELGNAWDDLLQKLQDATATSQASLERNIYQHGLTGTDAENTRAMALYDADVGKESYKSQLIALGMATKDAEQYAQAWYDIQVAIANEEYDYAVKTLEIEKQKTAELQKQNAIDNAKAMIRGAIAANRRNDYASRLSGTDIENAYALDVWDINESIIEFTMSLTRAGLSFKEAREYSEQYRTEMMKQAETNKKAAEAAARLAKLQKQQNAYDKIMKGANPFSGLMDTYNLGETAGIGGIYAILLDLVSETEAFSKLTSIVSDHIVPVLDAFLEPILPLIDVIGDLVASILQGILVPLFPVIVEISAYLVLIIGTIKNMINLVVDVIKASIGSFAYGVLRALDKIIIGDQSGWYEGTWMEAWANIDPWGNFLKAEEKLLNEVRQIRGLTFDIEKNTEEDPLKVLNDLRDRGIINDSQYMKGARVVQQHMVFDPVSPDTLNYVGTRQPEMMSVSYGGITINVNGNDTEEMVKTLNRYFERQGISYNMPLAMGGY